MIQEYLLALNEAIDARRADYVDAIIADERHSERNRGMIKAFDEAKTIAADTARRFLSGEVDA
jgi:hypothetical protein